MDDTYYTDRQALVIKARMYSATGSGGDEFWIDDVTVTAPEYATIYFPNEIPVAVENSTFGAVKALYR